MKEMTITYSHMVRRIIVDDHEKATAAYAKLKEAMDAHLEYRNDREKTVEIDLGATGLETINVAAVASVSLIDLEEAETTLIKRAVWERRLEAKVASALQPAAE